MIRSKSDSLTGAFSGNVGEPVMQECGWAGEPVMQEEWIAAAAGGVILQIVNLVEVRTAQGRRRYGK